MSAWLTSASTRESATAPPVAIHPMRPDAGAQWAVRANTRQGQCQRYQAYECLPMKRRGAGESSRVTPIAEPRAPAATTSAAPATGSSAAVPGNCVVGPSLATATAIAASPTMPARPATTCGIRTRNGSASAITAPATNSHTRVVVSK